jgi:purine-binding chemotaxis protein CheW
MTTTTADLLQMCSIRTGDGTFGIDTRQVREVLGPTVSQRVPLAPDYVEGIIPYRGEVLTTISFRALLGLPPHDAPCSMLVLDDAIEGERFGLAVDAIGGVVNVPRNSIEPNPGTLDARGLALFDGVYNTTVGLVAHLDARRLQPSQLANILTTANHGVTQ